MTRFQTFRLISALMALCAAAALSPTLAGAGESGNGSPVLIGATISLEGKYRRPSEMIRKAYRLWEAEVNGRGGLLGRPVQLLLRDDGSDTGRCGRLYGELIDRDGVDLVLSPYSSSLTLVASEVTEERGIVMTVCGASAEKIWERGFKNVFGVYATAGRYFIGFLDLAARSGIETVGILFEDAAFHRAAAGGAGKWARRFGMEVPFFKGYADSARELPGLLVELSAANVDGLVICAYPPDVHAIMGLMKASSFRPAATAITIAPLLPDFAEREGDFAEGIFGPSQWEADERIPFPGTKAFIRDFTGRFGVAPSYHAGTAYAACQILERAVRETGTLDHGKIRKYISELDTVTVIGRFKVDGDGRQVGHNPILIQWQKGKKEIVYPTRMKTASPRFSPPE